MVHVGLHSNRLELKALALRGFLSDSDLFIARQYLNKQVSKDSAFLVALVWCTMTWMTRQVLKCLKVCIHSVL